MSILGTIMRVESGGRNLHQSAYDQNIAAGTPAQGYFQITDPTWRQFGGLSTGYNSAFDAPYATQLQIAEAIPIGRWGPNTRAALQAEGYQFNRSQTLGDVLSSYGENPAATSPADGASATGGSLQLASAGPPPGAQKAITGRDPSQSSMVDVGTPLTLGLQQGLLNDINQWFAGLYQTFTTAVENWFGAMINWFTRGFLIIVGLVIAAIALFAMMERPQEA